MPLQGGRGYRSFPAREVKAFLMEWTMNIEIVVQVFLLHILSKVIMRMLPMVQQVVMSCALVLRHAARTTTLTQVPWMDLLAHVKLQVRMDLRARVVMQVQVDLQARVMMQIPIELRHCVMRHSSVVPVASLTPEGLSDVATVTQRVCL